MKGDIRAAWPLDSVSDASTKGHTLTNNNTVTFSDGGPAGNYANFVAASSQSLTVADHADFGAMAVLSVGIWAYRDIDSGAQEGLFGKYDQAAADRSFFIFLSSDCDIRLRISADSEVVSCGPDMSLNQWYYIVGTYDGVNQRLYVDGILVDTDAIVGSITNSAEIVAIGASTSGDSPTEFFDGRIGGAFVTAATMTDREIKAEYTRGLRRINSTIDTNDTISDTDVAQISADPAGKFVAVMGDDKSVYIFDEYGVPVASDTYPGTTARDVAVKSMPSGTDPHYIMAGSDQIELVQTNTRIE